MGMKQLPKRSGEYLFEIIMRRHQTRSTVMTSNRPLEDWGKLLGDVPSASAIRDRFLHHAEIIAFQGRSYRLRNRLGDDPKPKPRPDDDVGTEPPGVLTEQCLQGFRVIACRDSLQVEPGDQLLDGPAFPQPVIRGKHPVVTVPVLSRWWNEIGGPVEKLKRR